MIKVIRGLVVLCVLSTTTTNAGLNFGSRQAAIEVTGGTFDFTNNATLSKGTLRTLGSGSFTADASEYLDCNKMSIQTKYDVTTKGMRTDGKVYLNDDTLTLENNDILSVDGGTVSQDITISGADATPSIIQGRGLFDTAVTVSDQKELIMRWESVLTQNVILTPTTDSTSSQLTLENDLVFANGFGPNSAGGSGTAQINFAGHKMSLGGISTTLSAAQTWDKAHLLLTGDTTIEVNLTLTTSAGLFDGNGYKLTVSGGFLGSVGGTVTNTHIPSYDSGVFGGTGSWNLRNVILSDADETIRVNDGQLAAGAANVFAGAATWNAASNIDLLKDFVLIDEWQFHEASYLNGNGYTLKFTDITGTIDYDANLTLSDIVLANVSAASFDNQEPARLQLRNVTWHDGAQAGSIRINVSPLVDSAQYAEIKLETLSAAGELFGRAVAWDEGAQIDLLSNTTLTDTWTLRKPTVINGDNNTFNLVSGRLNYDADLYLSNIVLADINAASFNNGADVDLYLSNVTWIDDATEGIVRITGNSEDATVAAAQVELATSNSGNLFSTAVNWKNGVNIELLKGITFNTGAAWTFTKSSVINGNGNIIDLNSVSGTDPITLATGETLTITDAVIKGWGNSDITFAGGTLKLSNVTIIVDADVAFASNEHISIDGPVRFVTGTNVFDASLGDTNNAINGFTVWYDTLGTLDNTNIRMGAFTGSGRLVMMPLSEWSDITLDSGLPHVQQPMWLAYDINVGADSVYEALGRQVTIDNSTAFTLLGNGRSWYMAPVPVSSDTTVVNSELVSVSGSATNKIEMHDVVFDGWAQAHFFDPNSLLRYGTGTVIKLTADQTLTTALYLAHNNASESIVIDLNGYSLDMGSDNAALTISATDATVTLKNGRIINFDDNSGTPKLTSGDEYSTWIFQDIDMVLAGNTTLSGNKIQFKGDCTVTGTGDYSLKCYHTPITITDGAQLTVGKNMTLALHGNGISTDSSIAFGSNNSTLNFAGATFDVSNLVSAPTFTHGTMRVDDITTFAGDMTLGSATAVLDLDLDLMPAASIEVTSGTVTYANAS